MPAAGGALWQVHCIEGRGLPLTRDPAEEHPAEHPSNIRVGERDRLAVGEAGDRAGGVGTDAGEGVEGFDRAGKPGGVGAGDPVEVAGPARVGKRVMNRR